MQTKQVSYNKLLLASVRPKTLSKKTCTHMSYKWVLIYFTGLQQHLEHIKCMPFFSSVVKKIPPYIHKPCFVKTGFLVCLVFVLHFLPTPMPITLYKNNKPSTISCFYIMPLFFKPDDAVWLFGVYVYDNVYNQA